MRPMKKKLLTILITSLLMIGAMGAFLWRMNAISQRLEKGHEALLREELDTNTSDKALKDVKELELETLYLSGSKKNVITRSYHGVDEIYNPQKSADAEEMLTDVREKGEFTAEEPMWAYNPYGTNPESLYLYFESKGKCYCRYTVSVDDKKIPDFTRTLDNGASGNVSTTHEYQIIGLVPGKTNYIIMKLYNKKDELSKTLYYKVDMPESYTGARTILDLEDGRSKSSLQNGLFTVFQDVPGKKVKTTKTVVQKIKKKGKIKKKRVKKKVTRTIKRHAVLLYDNSGVLRAEFPTAVQGYNMEEIYDNLVYACDENSFAQVNALGQVVGRLDMPLHRQYGEFAYDGAGAIYVLAEPVQQKSSLGSVVKLEVNSEEMIDALDLSDVAAVQSLVRRADRGKKAKGMNQMGIDSIQVVGTNQILLGSAKYSAIFKISNTGSLMPKLDYVIADEKLWNISGRGKAKRRLRRKMLQKALAEGEEAPAEETPLVDSILDNGDEDGVELFRSQYGQNALILDKQSPSLAEGQYYISMLNNNYGRGTSQENESSYYYRYLVDEAAGTYVLADKQRLDKNNTGGNVARVDDSFLYCRAGDSIFEEKDKEGKLVRSFSVNKKLYRVYKKDWKGFWFS